MLINRSLIETIYLNPTKQVPRLIGFDNLQQLALLFDVVPDDDMKMSELAWAVLKSKMGRHLMFLYWHCETISDVNYRMFDDAETASKLCRVLGAGTYQNRLLTAKALLSRIREIRDEEIQT